MADIEELPVGGELNALVGTILKFECPRKRHGSCDGQHRIICGSCGTHGHGNCYGNGRGAVQIDCCTERPDYCHDPTAAMECWDWLNRQGFGVGVSTVPDGTALEFRGSPSVAMKAYVSVWEHDRVGKGVTSKFGVTPMHALALAVVAVAGVLKELGVETK